MVDFDKKPTSYLKRLQFKVAEGIVVEEYLLDEEIINERREICASCKEMDAENMQCKKCGCFLALKTKSKVNRKKSGGSEITHCPLNKWLDHFSKFGHDTSKNKP